MTEAIQPCTARTSGRDDPVVSASNLVTVVPWLATTWLF
jgi:hypothetical protein